MKDLSPIQWLLAVNGYLLIAILVLLISARALVGRFLIRKWERKKLRLLRFFIAVIPMVTCLAILGIGLFAIGMSHGSFPETHEVVLFVSGCLISFFLLILWCFGLLLTDLIWSAAMITLFIYLFVGNPALYMRFWADSNVGWAQLWMSEKYATGSGGLEQSQSMAHVWQKKAALNGSAEAQYLVGLRQGRAKDAKPFLLMAAEQGHIGAMIHLIRLTREESERQKWLESALDQNHPEAFYLSARDEINRDLPRARELMRSSAERGSRSAIVVLISEFQKGGVLFDQDEEMANQWIKRLNKTSATDTEPSYFTEVWIEQQMAASAEMQKRMDEPRFLYEKAKRFLNHPAKDDVLHARAIKYLRKSAEAGYGDAALLLAQNVMDENTETPIPAESLHWYGVAARAGNATALQKLIIYYKEKPGVTVEDLERSAHYTVQLLQVIQTQKNSTATRMRLQGWAGELRDTQKLIARLNKLGGSWQEAAKRAHEDHNTEFIMAEELIADGQYEAGMQRMQSAAERGNEAARYTLAVRTLNGPRSFDREIQAVTELQELDRLGYLPASFRLGMLYQSYTGMVPKNLYLARELFRKAEADDVLREKAHRRLQQGFELIENLRIDPGDTVIEQIEHWYETNKDRGNPQSDLQQQYRIYLHYFRDTDELKEAAHNGNDQAQYELAQILQSHDLGEAIQWLKRSAKQGNSFASYELAVRMIRGKKNPPHTISQLQQYARRAANNGHVGAMVFLAANYRSGLGGFGKDSSLAKQYYQQALAAHEDEIMFVGDVAGKRITIERSHLERAIKDL